MPGKVTLEITKGPAAKKRFEFSEHDVFLFGRADDCHMCLPDDPLVSRHHFILEVNPPDARLRDLGSLNGTYVNGTKHGGREQNEAPEEAAKRRHPDVDLKHGDQVEVGDTALTVHVDVLVFCCECGHEVAAQARVPHPSIAGTLVCADCGKKLAVAAAPPRAPKVAEPVRCQSCGKDVSDEVGRGHRVAYVCNNCRGKIEADPLAVMRQLLMARGAARAAQQAHPHIVAVGMDAPPHIAGYEIERELGHGGMGIVYKARREQDGAYIALKVMLARVAVDERARKLFQREIEVMRTLLHQQIVQLFEHGSENSLFHFAMEFCNEGSVDSLMMKHRGKLPLRVASPIMLQTLEGLAHAHAAGFVHRDLKPPNILLCDSGAQRTAKVGDFGLAKNFEQAGFSGYTMTGTTAGTPEFMPREQVVNYKRFRPAGDVWAVGATFYCMLTGALPRPRSPGQDRMEAVLHNPTIPIRESEPVRRRQVIIPDAVAQVIDRSLSVDVAGRYQDAGQMLEALRKAL
jgi:DNA-directed RNA polymerase subunit RPC12/RpoP